MNAYSQLPDLSPALPELFLAIGALALLMIGVFGGRKITPYVTALSVALLAVAALPLLLPAQFGITETLSFHGAFVLDGFARYLKLLTLIGSGFAIAMSVAFARNENFERFEYPVLIVLSTLGMLLMLSANDLITLYLGLELSSLALYVIAAFNRDSVRSTEAGLKYFVLGSCPPACCSTACRWSTASPARPALRPSPRRSPRRAVFARPDLRSRVHPRRPCLQDLGRAVPHVDAGRL